jgi:hypothetical protein
MTMRMGTYLYEERKRKDGVDKLLSIKEFSPYTSASSHTAFLLLLIFVMNTLRLQYISYLIFMSV